MKAIDTKSWAEFKVGDLFTQLRGKESAPNRVPDGDYNMINETSVNNGISKKAHSEYIFEAPAITVSVNYAQTVFLQQEPFCASVNILILKADFLEKYPNAGLYIVTLLRKANEKYNYGSKISKIKLNETMIPLPVQTTLDPDKTYHPDGYIPDWDCMEAFMEQINQQAQARLDEYKDGKVEYTPVDTESWQEFKIGDLFDVNSSKKIYHAINVTIIPTQEEGYYPYVVRQKSNNGIRGYIKEDLQTLNPENTITFAQDTAELFWQSQPYFTGNNVKVMTVKDKEMTESLSLFLISTLKRAFSNFSYVTSYAVDNIKSVVIQLPIQPTIDPEHKYHPNGYIPDWNYMENFMKQINQQAQTKLELLKEGSK